MRAGIFVCRMGMLFAWIVGSTVLCAQQPASVQKENGVYTLHADTHLVLLDVTVTDGHGHPIAGLTKDDFKLLEDGQPQTIKFFEEHAPVDPAEIAKEKAAALAAMPPNTFTNYEPFSGRPVTVLLLNRLFPMPPRGWPHQQMLDLVQKSPPDTPFAVYLLDSRLHLVQPVTTDRTLLAMKIAEMWHDPNVGWERMSNPGGPPVDADVPARRKIMTTAMKQLARGLRDTPGRKDLLVFTGNFQCSVVGSGGMCPKFAATLGDGKEFLCGLMDILEQRRIWIYRYYGDGEIAYGFGCGSTGATFATDSRYYTLYYTPTNREWSGKYRATAVDIADKRGLHLAYRKGYYGTPENIEAHYYTAKESAGGPVPTKSAGATIAATTVAGGTANSASMGDSPVEATPNPSAAVFSVQVIPASATIAADTERQEYRQLMLHFSMPASEFKVVKSDDGHYVSQLEIRAESHADGGALETYGSQVAVSFDGAEDPRIAKSTITAKLTVNVRERGKNRWIYVSVRDLATGQMGSMVIPMEQVKMPGPSEVLRSHP